MNDSARVERPPEPARTPAAASTTASMAGLTTASTTASMAGLTTASMAGPATAPGGLSARIQRCGEAGCPCVEDEGGGVQRDGVGPAPAPSTVRVAVRDVLASPGRPLDAGAATSLGHTLGHDFTDVRIHDDGAAARGAEALRARAWTAGSHIVFGSGAYAPETPAGRGLLAHELTHVVQQRGDRPQGFSVDADPSAELEAQRAQSRHT